MIHSSSKGAKAMAIGNMRKALCGGDILNVIVLLALDVLLALERYIQDST